MIAAAAAVIMLGAVFLPGCAEDQAAINSAAGTSPEGAKAVTGDGRQSGSADQEACYERNEEARLAGFEHVSEVQSQIPYQILVPTYLPAGFKLDPSSIVLAEGFDLSDPDAMTVGEKINAYEYSFINGDALLRMGCNIVGNVSPDYEKQSKELRGHLGLVNYGGAIDEQTGSPEAVPFESSGFYLVFWKDGGDLTDLGQLAGSCFIQANETGWDQVERVIENLRPLNASDACLPEAGST